MVLNTPTRERWLRIRLSVAAYAYEFESTSIISDEEFDRLAKEVDPTVSTIEKYHKGEQRKRYKALDRFFQNHFSPHTGQWIHKHPELDRVRFWYERLHKKET